MSAGDAVWIEFAQLVASGALCPAAANTRVQGSLPKSRTRARPCALRIFFAPAQGVFAASQGAKGHSPEPNSLDYENLVLTFRPAEG